MLDQQQYWANPALLSASDYVPRSVHTNRAAADVAHPGHTHVTLVRRGNGPVRGGACDLRCTTSHTRTRDGGVHTSEFQPSSKREPAFGPPFGRANLYGEAGLQAWLAYLRPDTRLPRLDFALTPIRGGLLALLPQAMLHLQLVESLQSFEAADVVD
jgi:hypothetical protein